jgi:hypothetical protein
MLDKLTFSALAICVGVAFLSTLWIDVLKFIRRRMSH